MASPLISARNAVVTLWEALTPPTDTGIGYSHLADTTVDTVEPDGVASHRNFAFFPGAGSETLEYGPSAAQMTHTLEAELYLNVEGLGLMAAFDAAINEAVLLQRAVNKATSWPTGVDIVRCQSYEVEDAPGGYLVTFALEAHTVESD